MDGIDPSYEYFDAPKNADFSVFTSTNDNADNWFDMKAAEMTAKQRQSLYKDFEIARSIEALQKEEEEEERLGYHYYTDNQEPHHNAYLMTPGSALSESYSELGSTMYSQPNGYPMKLTVPHTPKFRTAVRAKRSHQQTNESQAPARSQPQSFQPGKLTVPQAPQFHTDARLQMKRKPYETTEDQQLRAMHEEMENMAKKRKVAENRMTKAIHAPFSANASSAMHSHLPLTVPEDFHFRSDERVRIRHLNDEPEPQKQQRSAKKPKPYNGFTVPEPFSLHSDNRAQFRSEAFGNTNHQQVNPFVPLAQQALEFQRKTPQRFKRRPRKVRYGFQHEQEDNLMNENNVPLRLTVPEPFHFEVDERSSFKPKEQILSTEEREILEFEQAPKFKALPLNRKILDSGGILGIKKIDRQEVTIPEPFAFHTDQRLRSSLQQDPQQQLNTSGRLSSSSNNNQNTPKGPTIPISPHFHTKERAQIASHMKPQSHEPAFQFKAKPVPNWNAIQKPVAPLPEVPLTEPEEFKLRTDMRSQAIQNRVLSTIIAEEQRKAREREFKARPMPIFEEPNQFQLPPPQVTDPIPFQLRTENRGNVLSEQFKMRVEEENQREMEMHKFKAKPFVPKPRFEPVRSNKPLTEITDFTLNSDKRAMERQNYENDKLERELNYMHIKRQQEAEEQQRQQEELKQYRKSLIHKPASVPDFSKVFQPQPSHVPTTVAKSPMFRTRIRATNNQAGSSRGMRDL